MVSDVRRIGQVKLGRLDMFKRQVDSCYFVLRATQGTQHEEVFLGFW